MDVHKLSLLLEVLFTPVKAIDFCDGAPYFDIKKTPVNKKTIKEKELLAYLRLHCRVENLDTLYLMIQHCFNKLDVVEASTDIETLLVHYNDIAGELLEVHSGALSIKHTDGKKEPVLPYKGFDRVIVWNHLKRRVCTDFFVINYLVQNGYSIAFLNNYYGSIVLEDQQLSKILSKGIAETHLHFSAATDFTMFWENLMLLRPFNSRSPERKSRPIEDLFKFFEIPLPAVDNQIKGLAILRMLVVVYLNSGDMFASFEAFLKKMFLTKHEAASGGVDDLEVFLERFLNTRFSDNALYDDIDFLAIKDTLMANYFSETSSFSEHVYPKESVGDSEFNAYVCTEYVLTYSENIFLYRLIEYVTAQKGTEKDDLLSAFLYRYIVVKNNLYCWMVQAHAIKGLDYFKKVFNTSTKQFHKKDYRMMFRKQLSDRNLSALEIRTTPNVKNYRIALLHIYEAFDAVTSKLEPIRSPIKLGVVHHLIKEKPSQVSDCCVKAYRLNGYGANKRLYYDEVRSKYREQIEMLSMYAEKVPNYTEFVVGLDAASGEHDAEPWVFAQFYRDIRAHYAKLPPNYDCRKKAIAFSFHVGEDFRHLLSGLRHIHEVMTHFSYMSGDRIGHGIALGVSPEDYAKKNAFVYVTHGELLDDYLWLWKLLNDHSDKAYLYRGYLEDKIAELGHFVYGEDLMAKLSNGTSALYKAYEDRFTSDYREIQSVQVPVEDCSEGSKTNGASKCPCVLMAEEQPKHLYYLGSCGKVLKRMEQVKCVEITANDVALMTFAQAHLLSEIERRGIVVEINPTSNSVIGEIDDIFEGHIMKLNTAFSRQEVEPSRAVITTINSDDPSVFATTTSDEYAYIYYALLNRGYPKKDVLEWMEKLRQDGLDTCFVSDTEGKGYKRRLKEFVKALKEM